jgi:hypothetical protein
MFRSIPGVAAFLLATSACGGPPPLPEPRPAEVQEAPKLEPIARLDFNQRAAEAYLPLFWRSDDDGVLSADELVVLHHAEHGRDRWVKDGVWTKQFVADHKALLAPPPAADAREKAVLAELRQARPALIESELTGLSEGETRFVASILRASELVEELFMRQRGAFQHSAALGSHPASRMLFHRNQGPWCEQPATRDDPNCGALAGRPPRVFGLYPASLQKGAFCDTLQARKDAPTLLAPFTVVTLGEEGGPRPTPITEVWPEQMGAIARELTSGAAALGDTEPALRAYLAALATSFGTNDWKPADEAWSRMNAQNSAWYLRLGPDETYFEPCDRHAGFHMSFARINQDSVAWQRKLEPVKSAMEERIAELAGPPYKAREVSFHLPDFIDIVLNAGDSRSPSGATIGQSLPNWGPVANEGRGRTVAMTNIGRDADSLDAKDRVAASLLCKPMMADWTRDAEPLLVSTVLHEAAHNLGPSAEYKVDGKTADDAFGGSLGSTMEELKAQTAAWMLLHWLSEREVVTEELARAAHVADLIWSFGKIASGMFEDEYPLTYPQLAAIQMGILLEEGAMTWTADQTAANGTDVGCFALDWDRLPGTVEGMSRTVFGAKARNDVPLATSLAQRHVAGDGPAVALHPVITERVRREPDPSYVYGIVLPGASAH